MDTHDHRQSVEVGRHERSNCDCLCSWIFYFISDTYRCPASQVLTKRFRSVEAGKEIYPYYASQAICQNWPLKSKCTKGKERRVSRWEHEDVLDELEKRMVNEPRRWETAVQQ